MHANMAHKVTKGQIHHGFISQNTFYVVYYLCAKFYAFIKKHKIFCYAAVIFAKLY